MSSAFTKFAGICGILAGIAGLVYLASFLLLKNPAALAPALSLLFVGLFASAVMVALYERVREVDTSFALWGLLLGVAGAAGAAIHSAFDLANNLHPPEAPFAYASPIDPRGFLTFAIAGLAAIIISGLIVRSTTLPHSVGYFGLASGVLLIALYLAYLITLNALTPLVLLLILASGIAQPIWYLWIGWILWRGEARVPVRLAPLQSGYEK
jgi:hypothetical protein